MEKKWPLHPKPREYQLLYQWITQLAEAYEVNFRYFCKKVLKLTNEEINNLRTKLPQEALLILSEGTGVPLDDLSWRDLNSIFKILLEETSQHLKYHPDAFANLGFQHNSVTKTSK